MSFFEYERTYKEKGLSYEQIHTRRLNARGIKNCIDAMLGAIDWQIGSVTSTRLLNIDCKSAKKSCLNRVNLDASGNLVKPQKSRSSLEYLRNRINSESVGIENTRWINKAQIKASREYYR